MQKAMVVVNMFTPVYGLAALGVVPGLFSRYLWKQMQPYKPAEFVLLPLGITETLINVYQIR